MGYKERAQSEIDRQNAAKRAADFEAQQKLRNEADAKQKTAIETSTLLMRFEQLGISNRLNEINRDVWDNVGTIDEKEFRNENGLLLQKNYTLGVNLPRDIKKKISYLYLEVYGYHEVVTSVGMEGCNYGSALEWHDEIVGEKIIGVEKSEIPNSLVIQYSARQSDGCFVLSAKTNPHQLSEFESNKALITKNPIREKFPKTPLIYKSDKNDFANSYHALGLIFGPDNFDLELAESFIDHVLISDSIERIKNPLRPRFEAAKAEIESIEARVGEKTYYTNFRDPTPAWRRLLRPAVIKER